MNTFNERRRAFSEYLTEMIDGRVLGLFRILFSIVLFWTVVSYLQMDLVHNMFVFPSVNFKYDGLTWLEPLSEGWMNGILYAMLVLSALMVVGVWFRWATWLYTLGFLYFFLLDTSLYNNHLYLYALLAVMLTFTDAHKYLSLSKDKPGSLGIPRWQQWVFQLQFVIVYFYAGVVKLSEDWLFRQEPIRIIIGELPSDSIYKAFFKSEAGIYLFTYGGLILDLAAPLLLWYKPIRKWAVYIFIFFHFSNSRIFDDIGTFPFAMIASMLLFYEWSELLWLRRLFGETSQEGKKNPRQVIPVVKELPRLWLVYFFLQLLVPLRGFFLPNDLDWTLIGQRFSWRVKLDARVMTELAFEAHLVTGQVMPVEVTSFINTHQIRNLAYDPRAIRELAIGVQQAVMDQQGVPCKVKARIKVSRNGRPAQEFVDPTVDLATARYSPWEKLTWVRDFKK